MKGKITEDIFLRVGQGVMRIPRQTSASKVKKQPETNTSGNDTKAHKMVPQTDPSSTHSK